MPHTTTPHPEGMPRPGGQRVCISGFVCGHFCGWVTGGVRLRVFVARRVCTEGGVEVGGVNVIFCAAVSCACLCGCASGSGSNRTYVRALGQRAYARRQALDLFSPPQVLFYA
jgi:hypothetical protein